MGIRRDAEGMERHVCTVSTALYTAICLYKVQLRENVVQTPSRYSGGPEHILRGLWQQLLAELLLVQAW